MALFGSTGKKLHVFFANPSKSTKVVAGAVSDVLSGREVRRNTITQSEQDRKVTLANVFTAPISAVAGTAAGITGAVAGAFLPQNSKAAKFAQDHPLETTAGLGALIVAPSAALLGAKTLMGNRDSASRGPPASDNGSGMDRISRSDRSQQSTKQSGLSRRRGTTKGKSKRSSKRSQSESGRKGKSSTGVVHSQRRKRAKQRRSGKSNHGNHQRKHGKKRKSRT